MAFDMLNVMLAVSKGGVIGEMLLVLLAFPQLAVFFKKFPRLENIIATDTPRQRETVRARLKEVNISPDLDAEVQTYQRTQLLSTSQSAVQLLQILGRLHQLQSLFTAQTQRLVDNNATFTPTLHTLLLQRWRPGLAVQATSLNQQLLDEERDQLLSEVQERMMLSGQLDPVLAENDTAAGRLWDMSADELKCGDYQLIVHYGDFLNQQPELPQLAEQLGRSRETKPMPERDAPMGTLRNLVREPATVPEQVDGPQQNDDTLYPLLLELAAPGTTEPEFEFYHRLMEKQLLAYRLHGDAWREKITGRPVIRQDFDGQPRGPFTVCVDTLESIGDLNGQCAKALRLALMRVTLADDRCCFITLFSNEVVHYEPTSKRGLKQATRFLNQRLHGGTDLASCFRAIIERLQNPQWVDADAVVISDFIAQRSPDEVIAQAGESQRKHRHRFHAVAIPVHGKPSIIRIFDYIWHFDIGLRNCLLRHQWRRSITAVRKRFREPALAIRRTVPDRYSQAVAAASSDETDRCRR